ncbi:MAG: O-antigen polymerase [Parcubacteria group bacterium Gr01-1014_13]|nr:MAG: O-antigen polymerase [Parcubacteria group bacterium Gr01-1014_13]
MLRKIENLLILLFLFLLPWQTRYIWQYGQINSGYWEYGTFSIYATEILLWGILILFFIQHFVKKEFWISLKQKPPRGFLMVLLLSLALSVALSSNFWISYNYIFHILEAMALMTVLVRQNEKIKLQIALWAGAVVQGALAIWQFLTQHVWASKWLGMASQEAQNLGPSVIEFADQRWLRAYGSFGSPNSLGIYLAILFVLGLVLYLKADSAKKKIIISAGQLLILSGLLVSFSRGAWLAAVAGALCLLVLIFFKQRQWLQSFGKQIGFALAVIVFWLVIFYPVFNARFNFGNRLEVKSISERKGQYAEAISFIKSNPILGVGPGAYTDALYKKYPTLQSWEYQLIHNIYLLALVEIGSAGALLLFFLLKQLFSLILKNNLLYTSVVIALALAGLFDHWLWSMYTGLIFFWVIIGALVLTKQAD